MFRLEIITKEEIQGMIDRKQRKIFLQVLTLIVLSVPTVFAGGQKESAKPADVEGRPREVVVRFAEVGWMDIEATTAAARLVLEAIGYETTSNTVSVPVAYEGMAEGDVDVFLGNWMPSMGTIANTYFERGAVEKVRPNLEGAKYTLAVPRYLAEQGLTDFSHIADFADELDYTIHGIEAGNDGNQIIWDMIHSGAFGLDDFIVAESSEAGMLSEARARANREEPIVFLGWAPHPMNSYIDMVYLTGGDDHFGPDFGAATVYTNARAGFLEAYPNLERFFNNLYYTVEMENDIMAKIDEGIDARDGARSWLRENPAILDEWLQGVETLSGEDALPVVLDALAG
ncbi:glycine betaine/proline transport system substrate-binding protein [Alkalispirochaeta americana]|uniref:Glycine betaine/proline transport system substrate-binding protein n=2 Tax=Alkalispirochaeta americana TaxID=159291 RepID=A0A1N6VBV6_9SPIO|nr:glycine betaine/proline transport system substrate-binding protein [Alkalispirochaeta americana]